MKFTKNNPQLFYSLKDFPQLSVFEKNFQIIKSELENLKNTALNNYWRDSFPHYVEKNGSSTWKTFTFKIFGIKHPENPKLCPKTFEIIESLPDIITAEFSYLPAKTHIKAHCGFTKLVFRSHLGLIIPSDCTLRVGDEHKSWEEGKMLIFDDSFDHEAWNNSTEDRFVLMLDIVNPSWGYTGKEICKYKIETLQDEHMLKMFEKSHWIKFLERGEFYDLTNEL
jgi:ornithine lipid ester-linked acyl 2-hydroxylase